MKRLGKLNPFGINGAYVAGGACLSRVTKSKISDYDVYPKDKESLKDICANLIGCGFVLNITDKAITFKINDVKDEDGNRAIVQVMRFDEFSSPERIFDFFDFTVCMAAYDCDDSSWHFHEDFFTDVASKTLRFNPRTKYPLASLIRLGKYRKKGYEIGKGESAKIAIAIAERGLPKSWVELESQLGGVYGASLKLLSSGKDFNIDNIYDVLSDIEANSTLLEEGEFSWVKEDILMRILSTGTLKYLSLEHSITGKYLLEVVGGELLPVNLPKQFLDMVNSTELSIDDVEGMFIHTHKKVTKDKDGIYRGSLRMSKNVEYKEGEETVWEQHPFLFSTPKNKPLYHNGVVADCKIPVKDFVSFNGAEVQSKSIIVTKIHDGGKL
jgi:hypothetical protein